MLSTLNRPKTGTRICVNLRYHGFVNAAADAAVQSLLIGDAMEGAPAAVFVVDASHRVDGWSELGADAVLAEGFGPEALLAALRAHATSPAALTHYAWSLHDALAAFEGPVVELHLSNPMARESWRHTSVVSPVADGVIVGLRGHGYVLAVEAGARVLEDRGSA